MTAPETSALPVSPLRVLGRIALVVLLILLLWRWVHLEYQEFSQFELNIRVLFAAEQTGIFEDLANNSRLPPEERIAAIKGYYESGMKQVTGSLLDRVVESHRRMSIRAVQGEAAAAKP